jgi:GTP pyrophosphokinase
MIDVEWDRDQANQSFKAAVEVVALDRSRLLRDVANALGDHHVNIVSCETVTGDDRVARMRFGFEMSNPSQMAAVLNTIKQIDAVYDAYRILPGATTQRA